MVFLDFVDNFPDFLTIFPDFLSHGEITTFTWSVSAPVKVFLRVTLQSLKVQTFAILDCLMCVSWTVWLLLSLIDTLLR